MPWIRRLTGSSDTMTASAKAYVSALNKLVTRRAKSKPEALKAG